MILIEVRRFDYSQPYVIIPGSYAVRTGVPITENREVDSGGIRIVVGSGSAYDLYLSRHIQKATIVRADTSQGVVASMVENSFEVAAGVRQQLENDLQNYPDVRLLEGHFMAIQQAMAVPKG